MRLRINMAFPAVMFIAIVGTRLAGKSTVESYLVKHYGFQPVKILQNLSDKVQNSIVCHNRLFIIFDHPGIPGYQFRCPQPPHRIRQGINLRGRR